MNVLAEILTWSKSLKDWQSDSLRRIWTSDRLTQADEDECLQLVMAAHEIRSEGGTVSAPLRLSTEHVQVPSSTATTTILKSISNLKNVNAIRPNQRIEFGETGVTVVYGENATGKSGYSRILKRACRARGATERILPNVFAAGHGGSKPEATFEVAIEGTHEETLTWRDGDTPPACLSEIQVFDSKVARTQVDEANEVQFVPYGLDMFTRLANLNQALIRRCQGEIARLPAAPGNLSDLVGPDRLLKQLSADDQVGKIKAAAAFEAKDESRLEQLTKTVADYKNNDPSKKANALRQLKARIDDLRRSLVVTRRQLSTASVAQMRELWQLANGAREAEKIAATKAFSSEPLNGTGEEAWKVMFMAAKAFSETSAYPAEQFPFLGDESRCLLCQQVLEDQSKHRLAGFWKFLQADTARVANERERDLVTALKVMALIPRDPLQQDKQLLGDIRELSDEIAGLLTKSVPSLGQRIDAVIVACGNGRWTEVPDLADFPIAELSRLSKLCEMQAKQSASLALPEEQSKAEQELRLLTARKHLHDNKTQLVEYLETLKLRQQLDKCVKSLNTAEISKKQSDLMSRALTGGLESALRDEFTDLGVTTVPLKVRRTARIGATLHQLTLAGGVSTNAELSDVLSEGEDRVVAIASFLAELGTSQHDCGIVFDDPVSSLDQRWREAVARRLVREGKRRQVIIFTHDIVFLVSLQAEAARQQIPLVSQMVTRTPSEVGISTQAVSTPILSTRDLIGKLRAEFQDIEAYYKTHTEEEYRPRVVDFYDLLRSTWERAIEEHLFGDVVFRFRRSIETKRLKGVQVEDQDVIDVTHGMSRDSEWIGGHHRAAALGTAVPHPNELRKDLEGLEQFCKRVKDRWKGIEEKRKSLIGIPKRDP